MQFVLWNELQIVSNCFWVLASFFINLHSGNSYVSSRQSKTSAKTWTTRFWVHRLNVMGKQQVWWTSSIGCRGRCWGLRGKIHSRLKTIAKWPVLNRYCLGDDVKGDTCGEKRNAQKVFVGNPKENLPLGKRGCRQIVAQKDWKVWTEFIWLGKGTLIRLSKKFLNLWFP